MHIRNKKNDQAQAESKTDEEPYQKMMFHFLHQDRKDTDKEENTEPTMDMLDEGEQSVDSNKTQQILSSCYSGQCKG